MALPHNIERRGRLAGGTLYPYFACSPDGHKFYIRRAVLPKHGWYAFSGTHYTKLDGSALNAPTLRELAARIEAHKGR